MNAFERNKEKQQQTEELLSYALGFIVKFHAFFIALNWILADNINGVESIGYFKSFCLYVLIFVAFNLKLKVHLFKGVNK